MLFLAVFCGFLAENQREYLVERNKEKQYAQTLIRDIETDISNLRDRTQEYSEAITRIDTILANYDAFTKDFSTPAGRNLFYIINHHRDFIYTDRTMQQLKFAGGLRLLMTEVSDSIISYDAAIKTLFLQVDYNSEIYLQIIDFANRMVSYKNIVRDLRAKHDLEPIIPSPAAWISHDPELMQQFYNKLYIYAITNEYSVNKMKTLQIKGKNLIAFLKNEYRLD